MWHICPNNMAYIDELSYIDQQIIDHIYNLKQFVPYDKPEMRGITFKWTNIEFYSWITPNGIRRMRIKDIGIPGQYSDLPHFKSWANPEIITAIAVELIACQIHSN